MPPPPYKDTPGLSNSPNEAAEIESKWPNAELMRANRFLAKKENRFIRIGGCMPIANVRGVNINYEVLGRGGPWIALSPGGRRGLEMVRSLAERMASAGYRILIHDRRNCGLSDIVIGGPVSEYEVWADDLYALLSQLNALP